MQNIVQVVLQVLSHPAWQGVGSLLTLIGIIISLLSHRSPPMDNMQKNPLNSYFYFCPTLLAELMSLSLKNAYLEFQYTHILFQMKKAISFPAIPLYCVGIQQQTLENMNESELVALMLLPRMSTWFMADALFCIHVSLSMQSILWSQKRSCSIRSSVSDHIGSSNEKPSFREYA